MASPPEYSPRQVTDVRRFVERISLCPYLYDFSHPDYKKNHGRKSATWASIGSDFGFTGEIAFTKWKSIRDRYVRERRVYHERQKKGDMSKSKWPLYHLLELFIEHTLPPQRTQEGTQQTPSSKNDPCTNGCTDSSEQENLVNGEEEEEEEDENLDIKPTDLSSAFETVTSVYEPPQSMSIIPIQPPPPKRSKRHHEPSKVTLHDDSIVPLSLKTWSHSDRCSPDSKSGAWDNVDHKQQPKPPPQQQQQLIQMTLQDRDDVELYLLSLAPRMRKLSPEQISFVRLKMETLLFEVEHKGIF